MSAVDPGSTRANSVAAMWAQHDGERLAWAFRAYARFVGSLSAEIRERLAHKDQQAEAYVVVFGKTQVGKTTLLMELMGVTAAQMGRVARVLRGGRAAGQSATATTMEYRRSADQRWGITIGKVGKAETEWYADDQTMETALGLLRKAMETRQLKVEAPCVVFVPCDCFESQTRQPSVRMLDLPGDKPSNVAEQDHVHAMAGKYVPLADLVLLVGRGDDLSFLQGGGLTLPGVEDWQSAPGRFRIVTTYSFTAQSVRAMVRAHEGPADVQLYRRRLIEQIERSIPLSEDVKRAGHFFPLEFGQSWHDASEAEPVLYERVQPMMTTLKQQLMADIQASTTPVARLRAAVDAHILIARVKEKRLEAMRDIDKALQAELQRELEDQSRAQVAASKLQEQGASLALALDVLTEQRLSQDIDQYFVFPAPLPGDPDESVDSFKSLIRRARASMKKAAQASHLDLTRLTQTRAFWRRLAIRENADYADDIFDAAFRDFLVKLDAYWVDKYWTTNVDSAYAEDLRTLERCLSNAHAELAAVARKRLLDAAHLARDNLHRELKDCRLKQEDFQRLADERAGPISVVQEKLKTNACLRDRFEELMERDLAESQRFTALLDAEYGSELSRRREAMLSATTPVAAFIDLLAAVRLADVHDQVLFHMEPAAA